MVFDPDIHVKPNFNLRWMTLWMWQYWTIPMYLIQCLMTNWYSNSVPMVLTVPYYLVFTFPANSCPLWPLWRCQVIRCQCRIWVPQGMVLGPLLFLCHIRNLPECIKSKVRLFANDCLLNRQIHNERNNLALQEDLAALKRWAEKKGMRFNAKKCYIMHISSKRHKSKHMNSPRQLLLPKMWLLS